MRVKRRLMARQQGLTRCSAYEAIDRLTRTATHETG